MLRLLTALLLVAWAESPSGAIQLTLPDVDGAVQLNLDAYDVTTNTFMDGGTSRYMLARHLVDRRVHVSVYLKKAPRKGDSFACRDYFWKELQKKKEPRRENIRESEFGRMALVEFMVSEFEGRSVASRHVHAFLAEGDLWADIHISKAEYVQTDRAVFDRVLEDIKTLPNYAPDSRDLFEYGNEAFNAERYDQSILHYRKALEMDGAGRALDLMRRRVLVDNLGMAYALVRQYDQAAEVFRLGIEQDPDYPLFYYNLACVRAETKDVDGALDLLRQAFARRDHAYPWEGMPDPKKDPSFKRLLKDQRFLEFTSQLGSNRLPAALDLSPLLAEPTDVLRRQADALLAGFDDVAIRSNVKILFQLSERLIRDGREDEAFPYLQAAIKREPWALKEQLDFARMLMRRGDTAAAHDKAKLVVDHAEAGNLVSGAAEIMGEKPVHNMSPATTPGGDGHAAVLIPIGPVDTWLLEDLKSHLSATLGIPVYVQAAPVEIPEPGRDGFRRLIEQFRAGMLKKEREKETNRLLKKLQMTTEDLSDDLNVLKVILATAIQGGVNDLRGLDALLDETQRYGRQWNATELLERLGSATQPYAREKVGYLGVTGMDIYYSDNNYLFGLAQPGLGVMSYRRFTSEFNRTTPDRQRLLKRAAMQGLSSIGFVFGIPRCSTPTCARAYPHSLQEHDAKSGSLCDVCKAGFQKAFGGP